MNRLIVASPIAAVVLTAAPATATSDDIIVTARKREETLQSVPGSVSAISAAEIQARGIANFDDLARATPNISFITSGGDGIRPIIRGVSSFEGSPTVAIYLDEVPIQVRSSFRGSGGAADIRFLDIDRVEVLRGPQGTLFGGNSLGGAIRYVTRTPDLAEADVRFSGELAATRDGDPSFLLGAVGGTPLIAGRLGVRVGAQFERTGGWIDQVAPDTGIVVDRNVDRFTYLAGRAALLFQATDRLAINASWFGQRKDVDALSYSNSALGVGRFDNIRPETIDETFHLLALNADYDLDGTRLLAQVSWFTRDFVRAEDYSAVLTDFGLPAVWAPYTNGGEQKQDVLTAELRVSGTIAEQIVWTIGGYFYRSNLFSQQTIAGDNAPGLLFQSQNDANDRQWAIFGEASWRFLPMATLTLGARQSWLRVNTIRDSQGLLAGGTPSNLVRSETSFDPKVNLAVDVSDTALVYAQAAKGFRPGQGASPLPDSCSAEIAARGISDEPGFGSDRLWTYEAGVRSTAAAGRIRFNAAAFQTNWSDKPESVGLISCGFTTVLQVGKVRIRGFEIEALAEPLPRLTLGLNVGHSDARFRTDEPTAAVFTGDEVAGIAPWTLSASVEYRMPIGGMEGRARFDYLWRDRVFIENPSTEFVSTTVRQTDSYTLVNGRFSVEQGNWQAYVFVRNLLDSRAITDRDLFRPVSLDADRISTLRPRTIGVGTVVRF